MCVYSRTRFVFANRHRGIGDYRTEFNKNKNNISDELRKKLVKPLPPDSEALMRELSKAGEKSAARIQTNQVLLTRFSQSLQELEGAAAGGLVVPGMHLGAEPVSNEEEAPRLVSCDPTILVLKSKAVPKRLKTRGSDGKVSMWLVKGGEDLRQDERLQQLFASINSILCADVKSSQRRLKLQTYSVIPMSKTTG